MDLADIFEGPDPSDPPEDLDPLASIMAAIGLLAGKLRAEPDLRGVEAKLILKSTLPEVSIYYNLIWAEARKLAGLSPSAGKGGRPKKSDEKPRATFSDTP